MKIPVIVFGSLTEIFGANTVEVEASTSKELISQLEKDYPTLADKSYAMAVNHQMISEDTRLNSGDEVALLPPFSGG